MDVQIQPLTPELWPALAALFESGGDPRWCWCMYWRLRGTDYSESSPEKNRAGLRSLVDRERPPGLVAVDQEGRVVGWVSLGPREEFERLERSRVRPRVDDRPVWSIVCFVVARSARRQGLAGKLLDAAMSYAREQGAPRLEAYPVDTETGKPSSATLYTGTLSTFLRAGFKVVKEVDSPQATVARAIVRKELRRRHYKLRPTTPAAGVAAGIAGNRARIASRRLRRRLRR